MVLMDVEMPKLDGIGATRLLVKERVDIKILMLSAYADDERVLHGIQAGAVGYIVKDATPEEFVRIIRATNADVALISSYLANLHPVVLSRLRGSKTAALALPASNFSVLNLTQREQESVDLLLI